MHMSLHWIDYNRFDYYSAFVLPNYEKTNMDDATLNQLASAYAAAPSSDLALVLCKAELENDQLDSALNYLAAIAEKDATGVFDLLSTHENEDVYTLASAQLPAPLIQHWIQHLSDSNPEQAERFYHLAIEVQPNVRNRTLDQRFNIEPQKTKLRVIEKADKNDVLVDLSEYRNETTTFDDVVGLSKIKKQIHKKIILPFQKPSLFQRFKKKIGGGVLLYGPPGCGKTLLARATAGECNASIYNIEVSDVLDMYIGESEQKLHAIFEKARQDTPCVLFFDELEALAGKREHAHNSSTANVVSQFLTELDGFAQNNEGVLVLASTNVPWSIDAAFLRPGRFDRLFFVAPPDREARESILLHHLKGRPTDEIDCALLAKRTPGYSGADLENLIDLAADEAIDESIESEQDVSIRFEHFTLALKESRATTTEWLTTARNYARYANDGGRYDDVLEFINKHGK
jgi:SpoVK/Ycf46/Vps4 family AAA+-type ATPase